MPNKSKPFFGGSFNQSSNTIVARIFLVVKQHYLLTKLTFFLRRMIRVYHSRYAQKNLRIVFDKVFYRA